MQHAVKLVKEAPDSYTVGGYGVVWGGKDLRGEFFTPETDFWFDRLTETPMVLYEHGYDAGPRRAILGQVVTKSVDDIGLWIEAQIATASEYAEAVRELVKKGVLGWSSGAVAHLCEIAKGGEIKSWAIAEFSLTPDPCEPRTVGVEQLATLSESAPAVKSFLDRVKALPDGATPAQGTNGIDPSPGSFEALIRTLDRAVCKLFCDPYIGDRWCYVVATFPTKVIACCCSSGGVAYFEIPYVMDEAEGMPVLGEPVPVTLAYVPDIEAPPAEMATTATMSTYVVNSATALAGRVRVLHEGRVKEGRVLSTANRDRLKAGRDALAVLVNRYDALLTETEPKTKAEVGATRAAVEVQAAHARILALASGVEVSP